MRWLNLLVLLDMIYVFSKSATRDACNQHHDQNKLEMWQLVHKFFQTSLNYSRAKINWLFTHPYKGEFSAKGEGQQ